MEMTGERTLAVDRATAWRALNDVELRKAAIPGCESFVANSAGAYDLAITAAIGPVKTRFRGSMTLADVAVPESYTLRREGQGGPTGFARGEARVSLSEAGARQTTLRYALIRAVLRRLFGRRG